MTENRASRFSNFLKDRFSLEADNASEDEVIANISSGVIFKGTNLWILIFAIFIASVGLNVNSTAVIIGAMLISPLMGPIMGVGLSIGINDFDLMKRSLRNFGVAVLISLITSTLYFTISPLSNVQSELLARTSPTIWDVLIAFFGGLAGVVAQTRKDRTSTVISGVAIATALMPPLCTAGFGLATGNLEYFFGAFYLFFINAVFISMATFLIVRFLKYKPKTFVDKTRERRVHRYMMIVFAVTFIPSVYLGYRIVQQTIFITNASKYIENLKFTDAEIVSKDVVYSRSGSTIELVLVGTPVSKDAIQMAKNQLLAYNLTQTNLVIRQGSQSDVIDGQTINDIYKTNNELLAAKNAQITQLQGVVSRYAKDTLPSAEISRELSALWGSFVNVAVTKSDLYGPSGTTDGSVVMCVLQTKERNRISEEDRQKLINWLKARTNSQNVKLFVD